MTFHTAVPRPFRSALVALSCWGLALSAWGGPSNPARAETESLLQVLQDSGCQFNRNGSWYSGAEARAHLLKKLGYLEDKGMLKSTEDFINLGASTSSSSGKAYLVKCAESPAVESKVWLHTQLTTLRKSQKK
ncbi:DUF5329 domain-containing protein [Roseateles sp. BYS180W]|uniref:DUF5329 domain-containing protein n=1 Tax=Roseateles rivi TaxID=3299028 RepID=A0ABW7FU16_9BURK